MRDADQPTNEPLLEAYLDGLLSDAPRAAFAEALLDDPQLAQQVNLQGRIDEALKRLFAVAAPSTEHVESIVAPQPSLAAANDGPAFASSAKQHERGAGRYWAAAALAAAAMIAWVAFAGPWGLRDGRLPDFAPQPLADIYRQAVAAGFEPSYDCREPERFAAAFSHRQGKPLQLLAMPEGMEMLGLAYVSGLSRDTTAMLCRVDDVPVMVFVDRASADQAVADDHAGDGLRVFREERDGLVFYEVTPLEAPRAAELIVPLASVDSPTSAL